MKAIQFKEYGKPEVFQFVDVQIPPLKPGGVLVQVKAAGVNLADTARRYGQYMAKTPLPFIPGTEVELLHYIGEGKLKLIIGETYR
jgi:NADPH2:quinone reductase